MDATTLVLFVLGLGLLIGGAELLVRGASRLAMAVGISPLVVGLTVVAYGTSAPEAAVSVGAALRGQGDLALGNVVGSNIFNVLFILGASALVTPLLVQKRMVRIDVPLMIAVSLALLLLSLDGRLGRLDAALLFGGAITYTVVLIRQGRREGAAAAAAAEVPAEPVARTPAMLALNVALIAAGLVMLVLGSRWLVNGAVSLATAMGVSELVIGLTIVAAGTSLPEVATSILAAFRGERDIAVGNVVGSNIFNILAVLGLTGIVSPEGIPVAHSILTFDFPVMVAVAFACLPVFVNGLKIQRWEGGVFVGYYVLYTAYLILAASQHDALPAYSRVMLSFVLPITALTMAILLWKGFRGLREGRYDDAVA